MIQKINDEYRIASDDMQWIIQQMPKRDECRERKKEPQWKNVAYLPSLDAVIMYLASRRRLARNECLTATDGGAGRH